MSVKLINIATIRLYMALNETSGLAESFRLGFTVPGGGRTHFRGSQNLFKKSKKFKKNRQERGLGTILPNHRLKIFNLSPSAAR